MYLRPTSPSQYWRESFPYAAIDEMFAPLGWQNIELGRRFSLPEAGPETVMERVKRFPRFDGGGALNTWRHYIGEHAPKTASLHVQPPSSHFLVFDVDLRQQPQYGCTDAHDSRSVCPTCWPTAVQLYDILERAVGKGGPLQLPSPLVVYTGGGGVHYWYRCASVPDMCDLDVRVNVLLPLVIRPLIEEARIRLDEEVTTVSRHLIRMPFSLHDASGRVALPLSQEMLRAPCFDIAPDPRKAMAEGAQRLLDWVRA